MDSLKYAFLHIICLVTNDVVVECLQTRHHQKCFTVYQTLNRW